MALSLNVRRHRQPGMARSGDVLMQGRGLSLAYGDARILQHVDVDVIAGEVLVLIGPNGAGKSTLLGVLAGDITPDAGTVTLNDRPLDTWNDVERAMRRAVLLQHVDVTFPFAVRQVVEMGRAPWAHTVHQEADDAIIDSAMHMTQVSDLQHRTYTSLSGGERGRAALARVLSQASSVLFLDEPTAAMDVCHQEMVMRLARKYAASGCAVVVVMHALDVAAAYADRAMLLNKGEVAACGTPGEIFTSELLSAVYEHPIEVFPHPQTGAPVVLPIRGAMFTAPCASSEKSIRPQPSVSPHEELS